MKIEENKRFSESLLWKLQEEVYTTLGPEAWMQKGVPFAVTSNPMIAHQFAHLIKSYLEDWGDEIDPEHPIYIFDLGAGSGRLGYLILKTFLPEKYNIRYVMTDFVQKNLDFLQSHPPLQPFIEEGTLTFATYHHGKPDFEITEIVNPAVVIATYYFDTIQQDFFRIQEDRLEEGRVSLISEKEMAVGPEIIPHLKLEYTYQPVEDIAKYYPDQPELTTILQDYIEKYAGVPTLVPTGALQAIQHFEKLTGGRMLLLSGDQGVYTEQQVKALIKPKLHKHTSFSLWVNYDILARYFRLKGGTALTTEEPDPTFIVFAAALGKEAFPKLKFTLKELVEPFEAADYYHLVETFTNRKLPFKTLLYLIKLGHWDPINLYHYYNQIRSQLPKDPRELVYAIHRSADHFYPMAPEEGDFLFNLGVLLFEVKRYREAIDFFVRSLEVTGERPKPYESMAICYRALNETEKALEMVSRARDL